MPAYFDTHAHYFDRKFAELPGGASALLHDPEEIRQDLLKRFSCDVEVR